MAFVVVLLVFTAFAVTILARPNAIIGLAFGVYCFEQWAQSNSAFFGSNASFINLGFGVLTLVALLVVVMRGQNPLNPLTSSYCWFIALYLFAGISCLWALDRQLSFFLFRFHLPYMVTFVMLLPLVIQKENDVHDALITTLLFCSIVMLLIFAGTQLHAFGRTIEAKVVNRVGETETRLAPLAIADMAGQVLIIVMLMNFRGVHRIWQQLRWPIAITALLLIYRSESRGQLLGAVFAILLLIAASRGTKSAAGWIAAGVSTSLMLGVAGWGFLQAMEDSRRWDVNRMQDVFAETRINYVTTLLTYWAESSPMNWFVGIGSSTSFDPRVLGRYCHVVIFEVIGELGFIGLFLLSVFLGLVVRDSFRLYRLTKDSPVDRGVTCTLIGLFIFQMILALKQGSFLTHTYTWLFGLMISRQAAVKSKVHYRTVVRERWRRWYAWNQWQSQQSQQLPPAATPPTTQPTT